MIYWVIQRTRCIHVLCVFISIRGGVSHNYEIPVGLLISYYTFTASIATKPLLRPHITSFLMFLSPSTLDSMYYSQLITVRY